MAGYRCVNFYDLCRLCSSAADNKNVQIYSNDGLVKKINECLPIMLNEKDKLPKIICSSCHEYVEIFSEFRKSCSNAQKMLESCINSTKLRNGGQVYIKDETPVKKVLKPIQNPSPTKIIPNLNIIATSPPKSIKKDVIAPNQPDFLSTIMQAVGIQTGEEVTENNNLSLPQPNTQQQAPTIPSLPQYTLTLDGNTLKTGQIQYKIENAGNLLAHSPILAKNLQDIQNQQVTLNQVDEFLKLKQKPSIIVKKDNTGIPLNEEPKDKKPKFNLILQTSQKQSPKIQQPQLLSATPTKPPSFNSPNKAQILNIEKILPVTTPTKQVVVPIMVRSDGTRNTIGGDAAAQLINQAFSLATNQAAENKTPVQQKPFAYMQMKVQSNADGQLTLTPATATPQQIQLSLSPQQLQQLSFQASHPPTITVPSQQQVVQDTQTQTQPVTDNLEKSENNEDEMYDTFDNDYYPPEENELNESASQEKQSSPTNDSVKKSTTAPKKGVKTLKPVKLKTKTEASTVVEPPINPEHSEMAKKQLNQLTNFSNKRMENENSDKNSDINLTVCDVCKKIFKRKEFLMQHLKSHIGLRPFKCEEAQCNKSFSRKEHLLRHKSSHTGKKEFTCNICNKLFSRKDNLNKHRRIHPDAGQSSRHKSQIIKNESSCEEEKGNTDEHTKEDVKMKPVVKKVKVKPEKNEEIVKTITIPNNQIVSQQQPPAPQQPKIIQVLQSQQSQQLGIKAENNQQQIILSMSQAQAMLSQQSKAVYTIPTNFIINPHGTFMTAAAPNSDIVGNIKFETH